MARITLAERDGASDDHSLPLPMNSKVGSEWVKLRTLSRQSVRDMLKGVKQHAQGQRKALLCQCVIGIVGAVVFTFLVCVLLRVPLFLRLEQVNEEEWREFKARHSIAFSTLGEEEMGLMAFAASKEESTRVCGVRGVCGSISCEPYTAFTSLSTEGFNNGDPLSSRACKETANRNCNASVALAVTRVRPSTGLRRYATCTG